MKFMKLGSKPDTLQADGNHVRFVVSELPTDIVIVVADVKFYLHKFPLLSKSERLQRVIFKAGEGSTGEIPLHDFPGGLKAFEICVKFCYGMTVTLNAHNVVAARCAAEYLEMNEDVENGNLIYKIEIFLNSSILRSWKDSIIALQTTKHLLQWAGELNILGRCVDAIASKTSVDPSDVTWSYTYNNKKLPITSDIVASEQRMHSVPRDWWIEDICELDVDLYKRVMAAVRSKGRMSSAIIAEALKSYAVRWLPDSIDVLVSKDYLRRNRILVETIVQLLPSDGGSCNFLLKLLKVVVLVEAGDILKQELMTRIGTQLHKASVKDLLIPARSSCDILYDVELVQSLVRRYLMQDWNINDPDYIERKDRIDGYLTTLVPLGKLIDGYLAEIANDPDLPLCSFVDLSKLIPEEARPVHDGLYSAINVYLKEHPNLTKAEKKVLCELMDVRKLSREASIHATQNDSLPLRVVVQVLFFEQLRTTSGSHNTPTNDTSLGSNTKLTANIEEEWEGIVPEDCKSSRKQQRNVKIEQIDCRKSDKISNKTNGGAAMLMPSRSRRIFGKLWASGKGHHADNRSSDTSGSSRSPPTSTTNVGEGKSSGSSSRNRRHSIS